MGWLCLMNYTIEVPVRSRQGDYGGQYAAHQYNWPTDLKDAIDSLFLLRIGDLGNDKTSAEYETNAGGNHDQIVN